MLGSLLQLVAADRGQASIFHSFYVAQSTYFKNGLTNSHKPVANFSEWLDNQLLNDVDSQRYDSNGNEGDQSTGKNKTSPYYSPSKKIHTIVKP